MRSYPGRQNNIMKTSKLLALLFAFCLLHEMGFAQSNGKALTLADAIRTALEQSFQIKIAENAVKAADINNHWGTAGLIPTAAVTANKTLASNNLQQNLTNGTIIKRDGASVNNLNAGLAISWRVFDGMRMFATKKRLEELERLGEHELSRQMNELAFQVASIYLNIWRLKEQQTATRDVIRFNEERFKLAQAKFQAGTIAKPDLLQAELDLNEQKANLLTLENNTRLAEFNLNQVMAQPANTPIQIVDSLPALVELQLGDVLAKADNQNPQVRAAKTNLAILMQSKREVTSQRLPSATIGANYNFFRNRNAAGFTLLNQNYGPQVNFGFAFPIFNAGNVKRQEKVAELDIENQKLAEQQLRLQLSTLVQQAYANYENGKALFELESKNLVLAEQNNQINLERFRKQYITAVELRQSQLNYANARNRQANARFQLELAAIELRVLAGDILTDLVPKLN